MVDDPKQGGQFSFCMARALILFLILHIPLPLSPALEICPSAIAGLLLVSCVLQKQTDAVPNPLRSTYSHEVKYLQGSIRQRLQPEK